MSARRAECPVSVLVCVGHVWGVVEKLGKGLGQPEGGSRLLGYSLCGRLIFDVSRLESYVYVKQHHLKVVPSRHSSCPEQLE